MRTKEEILEQSHRVIVKLPKEGQLMVEHEHLFLELWIDIRDQLTALKDIMNKVGRVTYLDE